MTPATPTTTLPATGVDAGRTPTPDAAPVARRHVRAWPVVAAREIHVRLTDRNFLMSTLMTMTLMVVGFGIQGLIASRGSDQRIVVTSTAGQDLARRVGQQVTTLDDKHRVSVQTVSDEGAAHEALRSGSADAYLHGGADGWVLTTKDDAPDGALLSVLQTEVRQQALARNAAASGTTVDKLLAGTTVRTDQLLGSGTEILVRMLTGFVLAMLFYMVSLMFGIAIAGSVVAEKQSRIVEIIASAIPVRQLLLGKILGNAVLAFLQMGLFLGIGLIGLQLTPYKQFVLAITGPIWWFAAFFVAGFIALACLWAVAGSLASSQEDLQSTTTPVTLFVALAFFGGIMTQGSAQTVLSFVPIASGVAMPMRLLRGDVPVWQPLASLALTLVFAAVSILIGERLYRRSVLASGGRVSIRQALKTEA